MHIADHPAFADTELASGITPFPQTAPRQADRPTVETAGSLVYDFRDPERIRRDRSLRVTAQRHQQRYAAEADLRLTEAVSIASRNAHQRGHTDGYRDGFKSGTHWGMLCGAIGTALLGAIAVVLLALHAGRSLPW